MIKIEKQLDAGKYTALFLNSPVPHMNFKKLIIDGKEYEPVIAYDLPKCIAVNAKGDFEGKEINFA